MLSQKKSALEPYKLIIAKPFMGFDPNFLSLLGLIFPFLFFFLVVNKLYLLALISFVGLALDTVDGTVARAAGKESKFGGFLDSTLDRVADFVVISAFGFAGLVRWEIILPLLMTSYLISYIRSRAELAAKGSISLAVGIIERTERLVIVFIGLLLYVLTPNATINGFSLIEWIFITLILLSIFTVAQRVMRTYTLLSK